jgi:hypothetical protein
MSASGKAPWAGMKPGFNSPMFPEVVQAEEESLRDLLERVMDKLDLLETRINFIFGIHVLIDGKWVNLEDLKGSKCQA